MADSPSACPAAGWSTCSHKAELPLKTRARNAGHLVWGCLQDRPGDEQTQTEGRQQTNDDVRNIEVNLYVMGLPDRAAILASEGDIPATMSR